MCYSHWLEQHRKRTSDTFIKNSRIISMEVCLQYFSDSKAFICETLILKRISEEHDECRHHNSFAMEKQCCQVTISKEQMLQLRSDSCNIIFTYEMCETYVLTKRPKTLCPVFCHRVDFLFSHIQTAFGRYEFRRNILWTNWMTREWNGYLCAFVQLCKHTRKFIFNPNGHRKWNENKVENPYQAHVLV